MDGAPGGRGSNHEEESGTKGAGAGTPTSPGGARLQRTGRLKLPGAGHVTWPCARPLPLANAGYG